jgi:L-2-amino-thiazoline-4-carboxylic acid hydrolase
VSISVIEQARIQAQVLVPLVKALQAELGEARANAIVRGALRDLYRGYGEAFWRAKKEQAGQTQQQSEPDVGTAVASAFATYARDNALDYTVIEQSENAFAFDVTRCRYAEFYKELGEPELGFLLVCSADFDTAAGFGGDIELTRTQTIMQGAPHCDFRYRRMQGQGG